MDSKKKLYLAFAMNLFIFLATLGVVISYFFGNDGEYHIEPSFRFNLFTTDSNILCGAAALVMAVFQLRQMKNNKPVPKWAFILKYTGTCALSVTFFTVIFFLGPSMGFMEMVFGGTSIYMHFFGPIIAFISFCFFETSKPLSMPVSLTGIIPTAVYGAWYCTEVVFITAENGGWMDFYGFNQGGYWFITYPVMILAAFGLCMLVRAVHNAVSKKLSKNEVSK